jgi:hypothetical protein
MSVKPKGALPWPNSAQALTGNVPVRRPFYLVSNEGTIYKYINKSSDKETVSHHWFGEIGHIFTNYFHALAYSLKCEAAKNDKQKSHKTLP